MEGINVSEVPSTMMIQTNNYKGFKWYKFGYKRIYLDYIFNEKNLS